MQKPLFLAFWAKKANLGHFLAKMGKTGINCKVSEKVMDRFWANVWHTDGGTDGRDSLGLQRLRRETKN